MAPPWRHRPCCATVKARNRSATNVVKCVGLQWQERGRGAALREGARGEQATGGGPEGREATASRASRGRSTTTQRERDTTVVVVPHGWTEGGRVTRCRRSGHRRGHLVTLTGRQTDRERTHWHAFSAVSLDTMATTEGGWTDC